MEKQPSNDLVGVQVGAAVSRRDVLSKLTLGNIIAGVFVD